MINKDVTIKRLIDIGFSFDETEGAAYLETKHGYIIIRENYSDKKFYFYSGAYPVGRPLIKMKDVVDLSNALFETTFNLYLNMIL